MSKGFPVNIWYSLSVVVWKVHPWPVVGFPQVKCWPSHCTKAVLPWTQAQLLCACSSLQHWAFLNLRCGLGNNWLAILSKFSSAITGNNHQKILPSHAVCMAWYVCVCDVCVHSVIEWPVNLSKPLSTQPLQLSSTHTGSRLGTAYSEVRAGCVKLYYLGEGCARYVCVEVRRQLCAESSLHGFWGSESGHWASPLSHLTGQELDFCCGDRVSYFLPLLFLLI